MSPRRLGYGSVASTTPGTLRTMNGSTIAHLSDLHITTGDREVPAVRIFRGGVSFDDAGALNRFRLALDAMRLARQADHVVISGDLTADGTDAQFEVVAELLHRSGIDPQRLTIVPGNHDCDAHGHAFEKARVGALRRYAIHGPGDVPEVLDDVAIWPLSSAITQPKPRTAGAIDPLHLDRLSKYGSTAWLGSRILIIVQHHPPYRRATAAMQWLGGLINYRHERSLLHCFPRAHVLHGHLRRARDVALVPFGAARIFCAPDIIARGCPVRFYSVSGENLAPIRASITGTRWPPSTPVLSSDVEDEAY